MTQNKNNTNEKIIKNLTEICNNNKKIIELEAKLKNLEKNYKNNKKINKKKKNIKNIKKK